MSPRYRFKRFYPVEHVPLIAAITVAMIHGPYKYLDNPGDAWTFRTRGTLFSPAYYWELDVSPAEHGFVVTLTGVAETNSPSGSADRRAQEVALGLFRRISEDVDVLELGDVR